MQAEGRQDWFSGPPTANLSQDLPVDRDLFLTSTDACLFLCQHFFNISPSSSALTIYSHFPNSASTLSWKSQVTLTCSHTTSPPHLQAFWAPVFATPSAWAHPFTNPWPKLDTKRSRFCAASLTHPYRYQNHRAGHIGHHTVLFRGCKQSVPPWAIASGSSFWQVFELQPPVHLHNWYLSASNHLLWHHQTPAQAPEPPA